MYNHMKKLVNCFIRRNREMRTANTMIMNCSRIRWMCLLDSLLEKSSKAISILIKRENVENTVKIVLIQNEGLNEFDQWNEFADYNHIK